MRQPILARRFPLTVLLLAPALAAQQYVDERIAVGSDISTGGGVTWLSTGDIDGDSWDELVLRAQNIDWLLRGGPGKFETVELVEGSNSQGTALADLNGDGRADLLTQQFVSLGWYPGQAGASVGTFQAIQAKGTGEVFWAKAIGDMNNDGKPDVVTTVSTGSSGTGQVRWYASNGAGAFGAPSTTVTTPYYPGDIALGDFDTDGFLDLVGAPFDSSAARVLFSGAGVLAAPQQVAPSGAEAYRVETGDFDADGIDDLACYAFATTLAWFRGSAAGLTSGGTQALAGATTAARDLDAADIDLDGSDDLLAIESFAGNGRLHKSMGSSGAGLGPTTIVHTIPAMSAAAFEYDGHPGLDLAFTHIGTKWPTLRPGDGQGGFLEPVDFAVSGACADSDSVCAGDIDRDGALDLAFESGAWLRGDGQGSFHPEAPLGARPSQLVDLNGDGWLDALGLLPACAPPSGLNVSLGSQQGFGAATVPSQAGSLLAFAVADLDGDGDLDLASGGSGGVYTHLNAGNGSFGAFATTSMTGSSSNVGAGDLNADGLADLARTRWIIAKSNYALLTWALSTGAGLTAAEQTKPLFQSTTHQLLIDDVNGDQKNDVAWAQTAFGQVVAVYGDGAGGLGAQNYLTASYAPDMPSIAFADIDGDGERDVLSGSAPANETDARVSIARRTGSSFTMWRELGAGPGAGKLMPADFDADGQIDLCFGYGNTVRLALNRREDPAGLTPFGAGTFGCTGRASLAGVQPAKVGNASFRLLAHNLPPKGPGWFALGNSASVAGTDPFGLGALLHIDPLASAFVFLYAANADASGQADRAFPIPADGALAGAQLTWQALHLGSLGQDCAGGPLSIVSSRGLSTTIQP